MFKRILITLFLVLAFVVPAQAADFVLLDSIQTATPSEEVLLVKQRGYKTYWITIEGVAAVNIEVAPRAGDPFVPLVKDISESGMVDTKAPAQRTRVNVTSCTDCTVSVLLQVE